MGTPVVHFDIGCRDKDASRRFYETVFEWTAQPYGPMAYQLHTGSERGIQGFTTALGHEPHQYVMLYMEVDDIAACLKKVEDAGGAVVVPRTEIPGGGCFAWCNDPHDNLFGLWTPPAPAAPDA